MLYRKIESLIEEHLKSDSKKILLIDGARQIGKTYIINHVGKKLFENYIEINMIADSLGDRLFENTKTVEDFYLQVSIKFAKNWTCRLLCGMCLYCKGGNFYDNT